MLEFDGLTASDRHMTTDRRNMAACSKVFSELMGAPVEVKVDDVSGGPKRGADEFTQSVADFFGGEIEDRK